MKRRGFSLIEVIVVISILVMLAALLLPAFEYARAQSRAVVCQGNIKQLQVMFQQYEAEHEAMPYGFTFRFDPPAPGRFMGDLRVDAPGWYWPNYIGVIKNRGRRDEKIMTCPSKNMDEHLLDLSELSGNYGANRSICRSGNEIFSKYEDGFGGPPVSTTSVRRPGETLLLVDSGYAMICWWQVRDDPLMELQTNSIADTAYVPGLSINQARDLLPGQIDDAVDGRHPGKTVNVGYLDGHVAREKAEDLLVEKAEDGSYRNLSLWEPDPRRAN